ncbi:hypothetical protein BC567DRAFT_101109 [Phyllosticta citribraziliensis]
MHAVEHRSLPVPWRNILTTSYRLRQPAARVTATAIVRSTGVAKSLVRETSLFAFRTRPSLIWALSPVGLVGRGGIRGTVPSQSTLLFTSGRRVASSCSCDPCSPLRRYQEHFPNVLGIGTSFRRLPVVDVYLLPCLRNGRVLSSWSSASADSPTASCPARYCPALRCFVLARIESDLVLPKA